MIQTNDSLTHEFMQGILQETGAEERSKTAAPKTVPVLEIYRILNEKFNTEWFNWEPETIYSELIHNFSIKPDERLKNIIGALQVVVNTNFPFEMWNVFENISHAFNENPVFFSIVQPAELDEIALTIKILKAIRPKEEFTDDICGYIAASAKTSGVVYLPEDFFPVRSQNLLDGLLNDEPLKEQTKSTYPEVLSGNGPLEIQTQRLSEIRHYIEEMIGGNNHAQRGA
jgi:hypothetical protein